jgi:hypothetical protein
VVLGGGSTNYLGRLNTNGTWDTNFTARADSLVRAMAIQPDGKILVAGDFSVLAGQSRSYIGRLNTE